MADGKINIFKKFVVAGKKITDPNAEYCVRTVNQSLSFYNTPQKAYKFFSAQYKYYRNPRYGFE